MQPRIKVPMAAARSHKACRPSHVFPQLLPTFVLLAGRVRQVWYKHVDVQRLVKEVARPRWTVTLDGRPIQTPARMPLALPTESMALAIAMVPAG